VLAGVTVATLAFAFVVGAREKNRAAEIRRFDRICIVKVLNSGS